jgi:O-antigen ligase
MSRAAWVSFLIASTIGFICAVSQSVIHVKKAIMLSMVVLLTAGVLTLSFSSLIIKRFESDFSASWELRVQLNKTALAIAGDHPVGGVGLNNYTLVYPDYDPAFADQMLAMDDMLTVVHNVYLLILAEAGALGLAAFLAFYLGVFLRTASNLKRMSRFSRALALGILCGILGAMLCDLTEISLIFEVTMYTIPFLVGMLEVLAQAGYGSASLEASAASGRLTVQLQS